MSLIEQRVFVLVILSVRLRHGIGLPEILREVLLGLSPRDQAQMFVTGRCVF
jgi:hypothetical protein